MSGCQQTCPRCDWSRWVTLPDRLTVDEAEQMAHYVARALQWEWLAHWEDEHLQADPPEYTLISVAFADWVRQEGRKPPTEEIPPNEGGGQTVRMRPPTLAPEQAKQLSESMGATMATIADSIQNWATHMVPAIRAAADSATAAVRASGCQCQSSVIGWHLPGAHGCLYRDEANPLAIDQERWRQRFAGETTSGGCSCQGVAGHQRGSVGCMFKDAEGTLNVEAAPATPYGRVGSEVCACCLRVQGEPHQFPNCDLAEQP